MDNQKSDGHFRPPIVRIVHMYCTYIPQLVAARKLSSIAEFGYNSGVINNHTNSSSYVALPACVVLNHQRWNWRYY